MTVATPPPINAPGGDVKIYLKVKDVDLKAFNVSTQVGKCIQIGNMTLKVRPTVKPEHLRCLLIGSSHRLACVSV